MTITFEIATHAPSDCDEIPWFRVPVEDLRRGDYIRFTDSRMRVQEGPVSVDGNGLLRCGTEYLTKAMFNRPRSFLMRQGLGDIGPEGRSFLVRARYAFRPEILASLQMSADSRYIAEAWALFDEVVPGTDWYLVWRGLHKCLIDDAIARGQMHLVRRYGHAFEVLATAGTYLLMLHGKKDRPTRKGGSEPPARRMKHLREPVKKAGLGPVLWGTK